VLRTTRYPSPPFRAGSFAQNDKGVGRDYGYSEKLSNILDAYVEENGDTEILIN